MEEIAVLIVIFGTLFGIFYLYISTRNKERLALIEKGMEAKIFTRRNSKNPAPFWKVFILNLAVLLMGVGVGIFIASILHYSLGVDDEVAFLGTIFLMAGIGLLVGFTLTKKLDQE